MTDQNPTSRREFYAAVALTDLPMPQRITIDTTEVQMMFDTIAAVVRWAQALGEDARTRYDAEDRLDVATAYGTFAGRRVWLGAWQPTTVPEPALTGATRDRLEALTREVA